MPCGFETEFSIVLKGGPSDSLERTNGAHREPGVCQASHAPFHLYAAPCDTKSSHCIDEATEAQGGEAAAQLSLRTGVTNAWAQERRALRLVNYPVLGSVDYLHQKSPYQPSAGPLSDRGKI